MGAVPPHLDLDRPRGVGELLHTTVALFLRHSGLFLSATLLIVAPVVILIDGVWGGALRDGAHAGGGPAGAVSGLLSSLVIPPLVTGLHAVIVRDMGRRRHVPTVGEALREAAPRFPAALGAVALYSIALIGGAIALVLPAIWIGVIFYFGAQAAVLDGTSPVASLVRSQELVGGRWWRTFGALILSAAIFTGLGALAGVAIGFVHNGVAYVTLFAVAQGVALSLSALFGTLLFFSLRARANAARELVAA